MQAQGQYCRHIDAMQSLSVRGVSVRCLSVTYGFVIGVAGILVRGLSACRAGRCEACRFRCSSTVPAIGSGSVGKSARSLLTGRSSTGISAQSLSVRVVCISARRVIKVVSQAYWRGAYHRVWLAAVVSNRIQVRVRVHRCSSSSSSSCHFNGNTVRT
jgi:hypothetical protein